MQPFIDYETISIAANDVSSWQTFFLPNSLRDSHIIMVTNEGPNWAYVQGFLLANGVQPAMLPNPSSVAGTPIPPNGYPVFLLKNQTAAGVDSFSAITRSGTAQVNFTSGNFKY